MDYVTAIPGFVAELAGAVLEDWIKPGVAKRAESVVSAVKGQIDAATSDADTITVTSEVEDGGFVVLHASKHTGRDYSTKELDAINSGGAATGVHRSPVHEPLSLSVVADVGEATRSEAGRQEEKPSGPDILPGEWVHVPSADSVAQAAYLEEDHGESFCEGAAELARMLDRA